MTAPLQNQKIGPYQLLGRIAQGGMGQVYLADCPRHGRIVVKILHPDLTAQAEMRSMFLHEARLGSMLKHPNIATIYDYGEMQGVLYLAMEFVDGPSLSRICRRHGKRLPLGSVLHTVAQLADALYHAYSAKDARGNELRIVHRDVTPQNVLISLTGDVKLIDFGVAKSASQDHRTRTGVLKGKLAYMAPEQFRGNAEHRTDVFALGVILHELISGGRLFRRPTEAETFAAILSEPIKPLRTSSDIAEVLQPIVDKAVARDLNDRYTNSEAFAKDLRTAAALLHVTGTRSELAELATAARTRASGTSLAPPTPSGTRRSGAGAVPLRRDSMPPDLESSSNSHSVERALGQAGSVLDQAARNAALLGAASSSEAVNVLPMGKLRSVKPHDRQSLRASQTSPHPSRPADTHGPSAKKAPRFALASLALVGVAAAFFVLRPAGDAAPTNDGEGKLAPAQAQGASLRELLERDHGEDPTLEDPTREVDFSPQARAVPVKPQPTHRSSRHRRNKPSKSSSAASPAVASAPEAPSKGGSGRLFLDTDPWSTVRFNGKTLGQTPLVNVEMPVGKHVLVLRDADKITHRVVIKIQSDRPTKKFIRLEE